MRSRLAEALARLEATEVEVEEWAASQREASAAEAVAYKRRTEAQRGEMEAAIAVHAERRDELDALTQCELAHRNRRALFLARSLPLSTSHTRTLIVSLLLPSSSHRRPRDELRERAHGERNDRARDGREARCGRGAAARRRAGEVHGGRGRPQRGGALE